jgi:hypothetical protein
MPHWFHPEDRIEWLRQRIVEHIDEYIDVTPKTASYSVDYYNMAKDFFCMVMDTETEIAPPISVLTRGRQWLAEHIDDYIELADKTSSYSVNTQKLAEMMFHLVADTDIAPPGGSGGGMRRRSEMEKQIDQYGLSNVLDEICDACILKYEDNYADADKHWMDAYEAIADARNKIDLHDFEREKQLIGKLVDALGTAETFAASQGKELKEITRALADAKANGYSPTRRT